ncbi:MAG: DUF3087 family protein [Gammaproteobacteria bacterium]|nr:DUF3087 family protein [Gammaproteobacteria bacterium]
MFKIEDIDPNYYRKKTRKSTMIIMAIFIAIGFITARIAVIYFGDYSTNHIVLNLLGAFVGLLITFWIINSFFKNAQWMKEATYALGLKRQLMTIFNVMNALEHAVAQGDNEAIKILRFYQLGSEQMYKLDNNEFELIELQIKKKELETKMKEKKLDLDQTEFDIKSLDAYRN